MSEFEKKQLEKEFEKFTRINFEKPKKCRDLSQTRFYVQELCRKIEEFKWRFNYVPGTAYTLLAQYNSLQDKMIFQDFKNTYL